MNLLRVLIITVSTTIAQSSYSQIVSIDSLSSNEAAILADYLNLSESQSNLIKQATKSYYQSLDSISNLTQNLEDRKVSQEIIRNSYLQNIQIMLSTTQYQLYVQLIESRKNELHLRLNNLGIKIKE